MHAHRLCALLLSAALAACETAYKNGAPNEHSTEFHVPVGSRLVLRRSIELAPGQGAAYLQNGKLLPWYEVDQYGTYCSLRLRAAGEAARRINPDTFAVRKVSQQFSFVLARLAGPVRARRDDGDAMTYEVLATVMELQSQAQPEVRSLTCASWGLPQGRSYLTVEQIRRALGAYFTLELKSGSEPEQAQGAAMPTFLSAKALRMAFAKVTAPG